MHRKLFLLAIALMFPIVAIADESVPKDHAIVHVVFVVPYETPTNGGMGGMGGAIDGERVQKPEPRAIVGDIVLPIASIHPISISIDGEFVGHAMTGTSNIKPIFVLPHGKHKFEFSGDTFKTTKIEMTVIGTGSKQYLIVKLPPAVENPNAVRPIGNTTEKDGNAKG